MCALTDPRESESGSGTRLGGLLSWDLSHLEKEMAIEALCLMPGTDKLSSKNHPAGRQLAGARVPKVNEQGIKEVRKPFPVGSRYRLLTSASTLFSECSSLPALRTGGSSACLVLERAPHS